MSFMEPSLLRTTVVGSYPFPSWLHHAVDHWNVFGSADQQEIIEDAVTVAIMDQIGAGLDVITDGEQTRLDFNLSFYGFLEGISLESASPRRWGPPAHDQRGRHAIVGPLAAPRGLGTVEDFERLKRLSPSQEVTLKASVPGPYTLSGRLIPGGSYTDRFAVTEALLPLVRKELEDLVRAGCSELTVDEPSMSCYAHREDAHRLVDIFNRTVEPVVGHCRLSTHLCFGNFKGHAVGLRRYAPMFPAFMEMKVDEMHLEMASREMAELDIIASLSERFHVAVGLVDVKSYFIESPELIADRVRACLKYAPADRLSIAPDCGLSQTARWAAKAKLHNMVAGVEKVRQSL